MEPPSSGLFDSIALRLVAVFLLVVANGFFVAAEFALVAVRRSRIDQMVAEGDRGARVVQEALKHLDRYISATQLGITLASLALGWIGEPALASLVDSLFAALHIPVPHGASHSVAAIATAFLIITFLHIVFGELAPKSVALAIPEKVSKVIALPLIWFSKVAMPGIWVLNGVANWMIRKVGIEPVSEASHAHSPEELRHLVRHARAHGTIDESDSAMLAGVFDFHEKRARDVMRPRTEVAAIHIDATVDEIWSIVRRERYSRYLVYGESLDDVLGVFVAKDLFLAANPKAFDLMKNLREPLFVPDARPAELVLDDLRRTRAHLGVVLDEYGGTAGIITLEDLIEQVIGDINDEDDVAVRDAMVNDGVLELAGAMSLVDVRSDYDVPIPQGSWTTIGGYVFARLGRLAKVGDRANFPGGELEVTAVDGRRVAAVRVHRTGTAA
jgi:CBS domain containing-hemolysin-like protein